jgi:hypothetical protein
MDHAVYSINWKCNMVQDCLMNSNSSKEMWFEGKVWVYCIQLRMEDEGITAVSFKYELSFISF